MTLATNSKVLGALLIPISFYLMPTDAFAQQVKETFTANGTFTPPPGVTSITIESWGGGGAGGGSFSLGIGLSTGAGGGGGGYSKVTNYNVAPGNPYLIFVGTGGAGVTNGSGGAGGNSYFGSNVCIANGGTGGTSSGLFSSGVGGAGGAGTYHGGKGADNSSFTPGGGGGSAGTSSNGNNGSNSTGGVAVIGGGSGGNGVTGGSGNNGGIPGGGGGGSRSSSLLGGVAGGNGAPGQVIITYNVPSCTTLYWAGAGSTVPGSVSGIDFNTPNNWSVYSDKYVPIGVSPRPCDDVVINLNLTSNVTINFSSSSTEIHNLAFTVNGGSSSYNGILQLNQTSFKIDGTTTLTATNTTTGKTTNLYIQTASSTSVITYAGNVTTSASPFPGSAYVYPFSASTNGNGTYILNGNATLSGVGDDHSTKPASVVFDGTGAQTTTNNNLSGIIYLGNTTTIGATNTPSVELAGSNASGFQSIKSLTVKGGAALQIDASQSINANTTGGTFSLGANATMLLLGTSNYPANYSTNTLNATSTVNYNGGSDQNVAAVTYGNLIFSTSGNKTAQGALSAAGDLTIQGTANFNAGGYSHSISGNWYNNATSGTGFTANASTITFTGNNNKIISGNIGTVFNNLTINKTSTSNIITNSNSDKVFSAQNLTVTQGTLVLGAYNDNYNIAGNLTVASNGVLIHSVPWDAQTIGVITYPGNRAIYVSGNLDITGIFTPTYRSHVSMIGSGNKTIRTGNNPASTLSILTFSNGNFTTNGNLFTNQEVWDSWSAPATLNIVANCNVTFPTFLVINGGSFNMTGGSLNITGNLNVADISSTGTITVSGGDIHIFGNLENGNASGTGSINMNAGTLTIDGNLNNGASGEMTFGTVPVKIGGNFVNNGTLTSGNSTFTFQGAGNEQISGAANITFYNLEINGYNVQILKNISLNNNLTLTKGIFDLQSYTANRSASGGTISAASGSELDLSGSTGGVDNSNFPNNFSTITLYPASTVNYYGVAQDIYDTPDYGNLIISNTGLKTASGNLTVQKDFTMQTGATFKAGNFTHTFSGNLINNTSDNGFGYDNSTVKFNGTSVQNIGGSFGTSFNSFVMANSAGINLNKPVSIYESLTKDAPGRVLNTNDNLTIKSLQTKTAYVGNMSGSTINGKATVERYVSAHKAWRFVSVPTTGGQNIKDAWQEGSANGASNPNPGYGIQITGTPANWAALGFDKNSPAPSMKYYDGATDTWIGVASTNATPISNVKGYMVFVRGDRLATDINSTPTQTNLRTKDNLKTGTQPVIDVLPGKYESIGNPYACPIDFTKISIGSAISNFFYLWDPFLAGVYGYGGYQTFSAANGWYPVPGGTASYPTNKTNTIIPSGQAFFVKGNTGTGTDLQVQISETAKAAGNSETIDRPMGTKSTSEFFRASLFNNSGLLVDGNAVAFNDQYSDAVNGDDAPKFAMTGENFGLVRQGRSLAVEARNDISANDTIFYKVSGLAKQNYRIAFAPKNMDRTLQAILIDNYTKTNTDLSVTDTSWYGFNVNNDAGSFASTRFSVVFRPMTVLPETFGTIKAYGKSNVAIVEWNVYDEKNVKEYQIERSTDGSNFTVIGTQAANNNLNGAYSFTDNQPQSGINYYRIRSVDLDGSGRLSDIAKANLANLVSTIEVFPNPVVNNKVQIKFANQPEGTYQIELFNPPGQMIKKATQDINTGNQLITILLSHKLNTGIYPLVITNNAGIKTTLNVIVK